MPSAAVNDNGFFCKPGHACLSAEVLETVAQACESFDRGRSFSKLLRASCTQEKMAPNVGPYPIGYIYRFILAPGSFGHSTHAWDIDARLLRSAWMNLAQLRTDWNKVQPVLVRSALPGATPTHGAAKSLEHLNKALLCMEAFIPRASAMKRYLDARTFDLAPGWQAEGGAAFAIWMTAPKPGFMSDTKRPVGAAAARLFESVEAARLKAKALSFGGLRRGPAAIVRLRIEVVDIESIDPGASSHGPRMAMARREAEALHESLMDASLDEIERALGDASPCATVSPAPACALKSKNDLSGRDEGFACWVDWGSLGPLQGFINARGAPGSLLGATLKATPAAAAKQTAGLGLATVTRIACCPEKIEILIGDPDLSKLHSSIVHEAQTLHARVLARQKRDALLARANELRAHHSGTGFTGTVRNPRRL